MQFRSLRFSLIVVLSTLIPSLAQFASADVIRKFAASYQLSNIVESGSQVDVTITLTLMNPANSDVKGGIVVLYNTEPTRSFLGSFDAIQSLPRMGETTVSQSFTISAAEYAHWQQGHAPTLEFLVPHGAGTYAYAVQARQVVEPGKPSN